ncbi:30S ribosomal protein S8 [Candidatus Kaiserbacteria bacterium]|nr:30S ribosomal protein S8 [Candidatus Kaiserbacteria bacterium]
MVSDPVGDFVVQLMNGAAVRKRSVSVPYSKLKAAIAEKLVEAGYLKAVAKRGKKVRKTLEVELAYEKGAPAIRGVKRISKPGRRMYAGVADIHPVKFGIGSIILSTPKGIVTGEEARKEQVGGEQLFTIW